jgi:DNA uptake protein ComE-like DNA-binding protein
MSKDLFRSLAKAIGGRVKSLLVQAAKDEASRAVRHFRARMQEPRRSGETTPPGSSMPALAPAEAPVAAPGSGAHRSRGPGRAAAKQARTGDTVHDTVHSARAHAAAKRARTGDTVQSAGERAAGGRARTGDTVRSAGAHAAGGRDDPPADAVLDLNAASKDELVALPGIGDARADAIIRGRPFTAPEDLVARKILPGSVFATVKDRIGVA